MRKEVLLLLIFTVFLFLQKPNTQTTVKIVKITNASVERNVSKILLTAVDRRGNGVALPLIVESLPGKGRLLVDINLLLFWIDTQQSIQIAKEVASEYLGRSLDNVDLIYSIEASNVSIVGGPSAGAAITVATIAALEGKPINQSIFITGTIEPDGSIGPVGGIEAKAIAAKNYGATLFLVPYGQGKEINYVPKEECKKIVNIVVCTISYEREYVDISERVGIKVVEVRNIEEVLRYYGL